MNAPLPSSQREAIARQLGDVKPATDGLLASFAEAIANVRDHDHPSWEDLYCMNLTSYMGERMAPVLRRLLDTEVAARRWHERTEEAETAEAQLRGQVRGLRAHITELESQVRTLAVAARGALPMPTGDDDSHEAKVAEYLSTPYTDDITSPEDPHDSLLHTDYTTPHDLPEVPGQADRRAGL